MTIGTVVLLPPAQLPGEAPATSPDRREIAAELAAYGIKVLIVPAPEASDQSLDSPNAVAHWVAHNAVAIAKADPARPILLVAAGGAASLLPAVGFSQKASRRPVAGYVMIDGTLPKPGHRDWPDAPITFLATPVPDGAPDPRADQALKQADLRGWEIALTPDPARSIRLIVEDS